MNNEQQIRSRIENWVKAAQERNFEGVMAWHHPEMVMYDVPPPFQSIGLDAYRKTWELFFSCLKEGNKSFQMLDPHITAGEDVAFCHSPMKCIYFDASVQNVVELDFRLTIGFKKIDGEWWFMHEHHSVPSE